MDLVNAIVNFNQSATLSSVQMAVAKKVLDVQQYSGDAAVKLIQAASQGINQAGDSLVAAATGLGGQIDTYG
jgi:hypothetical protein